jgi:lipopolysaccharide export system permease protein
MKLIDKYIFKQGALATIVGLIAFIVVWISPEILAKIIKKVVAGQVSPVLAVKLFFLEIPEILGNLIPASLMLGSIWVFDQLSKNSELTILRGIGISFRRLTVPVIVLSLFGVIFSFLTHEYLIPYSTTSLKILKQEAHIDHFVFVDKTKSGKPKEILIVGDFNSKVIRSVKSLKFSDTVSHNTPLLNSINIAKVAKQGKDFWTLNNGIEYQIGPDGVYKNIKPFDSIKALSPDSSEKAYSLLIYSTKKPEEMNLATIKDYLKLLKSASMNTEYNYILSKYYQRFAQPFSCVLFALCGIILGFSKPREGKFLGFTIGVALIFLYFITAPFIEMLAHIGIVQPVLAAWIPNMLIMLSIIGLVKYKQV